MIDFLGRLKRWLKPRHNKASAPRVGVCYIYAPSAKFYETFRKYVLRFPLNLLPTRYCQEKAFQHFLPNNLLRLLHRDEKIRLHTHQLKSKPHPIDAAEVANIPHAEAWVFALFSDSSEPLVSADFLEEVRTRAKREGIRIINLSSHTGTPVAFEPKRSDSLPALAKLKANGLTTPGDKSSFALFHTEADRKAWQEQVGKDRISEYEIQPFLEHRQNSEIAPFRCIERWICVCGDLTVGTRLSNDLIIKQLNSLTYYARDPRLLEREYRAVLKARKLYKVQEDGPGHLSFSYSGSADFWDQRHALYQALRDATGFEIGSMDVIEDDSGKLFLIDYNEWTFESARDDLSQLWQTALFDAVVGKEAN